MTSTPTRSKAVSFKFPGSKSLTPGTLPQSVQKTTTVYSTPKASSPVAIHGASSPSVDSSKQSLLASEHVPGHSSPTAQHGAKPDLVADIIDASETAHSRKGVNHDSARNNQSSQPARSGTDGRTETQNPESRSSPYSRNLHLGGRVYSRTGTKAFANTTSTRDRSPLLDQQKHRRLGMTNAQVAQMASQIRGATNTSSHEYARALKYDAARLREHLLKVEEEIKNLNRGRGTLELAVQDVRKALSVNQQSISTQQKKSSRGEEVCATIY